MDTNEPPDTATERTETQPADVQPAQEPSLTPPSPYSGPKDKPSVIDAVIAGRCTTREAAETLDTTTDQVRAWKARETARRARPAKPARVFRPVSPPVIDQDDEPHGIDDEGDRPETPPETLSASEPLQDLQIQDGEPTETGGETPETADRNTLPDSTASTAAPETPSMPHPFRAQALANLAKAHEATRNRDKEKPKIDEGSFERDELETLDNLHRIITRNAKRAESGKDCQGWTASLAIVLDLRRRAAGKDSTLVKSQSTKASQTRNSIVFIGPSPAPSAAHKHAQHTRTIDVATSEPDAGLNDAPPALKAALRAAPSYVREL